MHTRQTELSADKWQKVKEQTSHWHAWVRFHHFDNFHDSTNQPLGPPPSLSEINSGKLQQDRVHPIHLNKFIDYGTKLRLSNSVNKSIVYYI